MFLDWKPVDTQLWNSLQCFRNGAYEYRALKNIALFAYLKRVLDKKICN